MIASVCLLAASDTAAAATLQIGSVTEIGSGALPSAISSGGFGVQISEGTGSYAVPPGYGTITAWSHSAGTTAGMLTFKVYRPTGALHEFLVVGSDTQPVAAGSVQTFAVQIPVQPGDRIGLSSDDVELAFETFGVGDQIGFFGADLPIGTTRATDGDPFPDYKLDVAATLASDEPPPDPAGTPPPPPGPVAPRLTQLALTPPSFAAARTGPSTRSTPRRGSGTRLRFRLDRAASVRFSVQRVATRAPRYVAVGGSFSKPAKAAVNGFTFTGRIGGRTLKPGAYRLIATPTAGGVVGNTVTRNFRIRR